MRALRWAAGLALGTEYEDETSFSGQGRQVAPMRSLKESPENTHHDRDFEDRADPDSEDEVGVRAGSFNVAKGGWMTDDASMTCLLCDALFTFTNRRHHCRHCLKLVCSACSSNLWQLEPRKRRANGNPRAGYKRVCDTCFATLEATKEVKVGGDESSLESKHEVHYEVVVKQIEGRGQVPKERTPPSVPVGPSSPPPPSRAPASFKGWTEGQTGNGGVESARAEAAPRLRGSGVLDNARAPYCRLTVANKQVGKTQGRPLSHQPSGSPVAGGSPKRPGLNQKFLFRVSSACGTADYLVLEVYDRIGGLSTTVDPLLGHCRVPLFKTRRRCENTYWAVILVPEGVGAVGHVCVSVRNLGGGTIGRPSWNCSLPGAASVTVPERFRRGRGVARGRGTRGASPEKGEENCETEVLEDPRLDEFYPSGSKLHEKLFFRVGYGPKDVVPLNERVLVVFQCARMRRRVEYASPGDAGGLSTAAAEVEKKNSRGTRRGSRVNKAPGIKHHGFRASGSMTLTTARLSRMTGAWSLDTTGPALSSPRATSGRSASVAASVASTSLPSSDGRESGRAARDVSPLAGARHGGTQGMSGAALGVTGARRCGRAWGGGGFKRRKGFSASGALVLTSHRVLFLERDEECGEGDDRYDERFSRSSSARVSSASEVGDLIQIPLAFISETRVKRRTNEDLAGIQIECRDERTFYFAVARGPSRAADALLMQGVRRFDDEIAWLIAEDNFARSTDTCRVDASSDPRGETLVLDPDANLVLDECDPDADDTWCTRGFPSGYNPALEFRRQGIDLSTQWDYTGVNHSFGLCPTYPRFLVIPSVTSESDIKKASKGRSRCRIPALTWLHPLTGAALCRSSQPLIGLGLSQASPEDEQLLIAIRAATEWEAQEMSFSGNFASPSRVSGGIPSPCLPRSMSPERGSRLAARGGGVYLESEGSREKSIGYGEMADVEGRKSSYPERRGSGEDDERKPSQAAVELTTVSDAGSRVASDVGSSAGSDVGSKGDLSVDSEQDDVGEWDEAIPDMDKAVGATLAAALADSEKLAGSGGGDGEEDLRSRATLTLADELRSAIVCPVTDILGSETKEAGGTVEDVDQSRRDRTVFLDPGRVRDLLLVSSSGSHWASQRDIVSTEVDLGDARNILDAGFGRSQNAESSRGVASLETEQDPVMHETGEWRTRRGLTQGGGSGGIGRRPKTIVGEGRASSALEGVSPVRLSGPDRGDREPVAGLIRAAGKGRSEREPLGEDSDPGSLVRESFGAAGSESNAPRGAETVGEGGGEGGETVGGRSGRKVYEGGLSGVEPGQGSDGDVVVADGDGYDNEEDDVSTLSSVTSIFSAPEQRSPLSIFRPHSSATAAPMGVSVTRAISSPGRALKASSEVEHPLAPRVGSSLSIDAASATSIGRRAFTEDEEGSSQLAEKEGGGGVLFRGEGREQGTWEGGGASARGGGGDRLPLSPLRENAVLRIVDARSMISAKSNLIMGKGHEVISRLGGHRCASLTFLEIPNVYVMQQSYSSLLAACSAREEDPAWLLQLHNSRWMEYVSLILKGASGIAASLEAGDPVLVHCSDGWDRTPQLVSIAQILVDPYFRTIEGFQSSQPLWSWSLFRTVCVATRKSGLTLVDTHFRLRALVWIGRDVGAPRVLVSKDWCSFGHRFASRAGHGRESRGAASPIFVQFLDATFQLLRQFPTAFEFSEELLLLLMHAVRSRWFNDFLHDSEYERVLAHAGLSHAAGGDRAFSVWSHVRSCSERYRNVIWNGGEEARSPGKSDDGGSPGRGRPACCGYVWEDSREVSKVPVLARRRYCLGGREIFPPRLWPSCGVRSLVVWEQAHTGVGFEFPGRTGQNLTEDALREMIRCQQATIEFLLRAQGPATSKESANPAGKHVGDSR